MSGIASVVAVIAAAGQAGATLSRLPSVAEPKASASQASASSTQAARVAMAAYVGCLFRAKGYQLRAMALAPVGGRTNWGAMATGGCLDGTAAFNGSLRFAPNLIRGALFEEMYRADFGKSAGAEAFDTVPAIAYEVSPPEDGATQSAYRTAMMLADCAVRRAPSDARATIMAPVGSLDEKTAMRAFTPTLSACLPAGVDFKLNYSSIRNMTAEALYRLTIAKRDNKHA